MKTYKMSEVSIEDNKVLSDFSREFIESLNPAVKIVDTDGVVDLFCYTNCDENEPEHIKSCRGIVFKGDELVLKAFSFTPEYTSDNFDMLDERFPDVSNFTIFDSYEGSLIRIFYCDKWYVSTHRRLDAFTSKWSSKQSFGYHFKSALEHEFSTNPIFKNRILNSKESPEASILDKFISTLDTKNQYMFLLQNNIDNRIVCNAPQYPRVYHVGTFDGISNELNMNEIVDLPYPRRHAFKNMNDIFDYVENVANPMELQGLIMFTGKEEIKFVSRNYAYLSSLRNNEASVKFRYLQIRMEDAEKREDFIKLYPEHLKTFDLYENILYKIAIDITDAYISRYIHKNFTAVPQDEFSILKICHQWHKLDRKNNRISFNKVMNVLNEQSYSKLNKMIRRVIVNERKKDDIENNSVDVINNGE